MERTFFSNTGNVYHVFTDGSFKDFTMRGGRRRRGPARCGWGFTIFSKYGFEEEPEPEFRLCGPVVLSREEELFVGAVRLSNNVAELQAALECSLWLLGQLSSPAPLVPQGAFVLFTFDSQYVQKLILAQFQPRFNVVLVCALRAAWKACAGKFNMIDPAWIKSHTGHYGNEMADELAEAGAGDSTIPYRANRRPYHLCHWDENDYLDKLDCHPVPEEETHLLRLPFGRLVRPRCEDLPAQTGTAGNISAEVSTTSQIAERREYEAVTREILGYGGREPVVPTLTELATLIRDASEQFGHVQRRRRVKLQPDHPLMVQLRTVQNLRHGTSVKTLAYLYATAAHQIKHKIAQESFKLQCADVLNRGRTLGGMRSRTWKSQLRRADGSLTTDAAEMQDIATSYYEDLFRERSCAASSAHSSQATSASWCKRWRRDEVEGLLRKVTPYRIRQLVAKLRRGKTCSREDRVTAEMLQELPDDVYETIAEIFSQRILNSNRTEANDSPGVLYEITLLEKVMNPMIMRNWRPIAVMSVFSKLYSMLLSDVGGLRNVAINDCQFAFRPGFQSAEVLFVLRQLIEKSIEFGTNLLIFDGDIYKAYDTVNHHSWSRAYGKAGIHPAVTSAFVREVRESEGRVRLPGLQPGRVFRRGRSMFQGDPEAPYGFNIVLDREVVQPFLVYARSQYWGAEVSHEDLEIMEASIKERPAKLTRCGTERTPLLLFADNFWLIATSTKQLRSMRRILRAPGQCGLWRGRV